MCRAEFTLACSRICTGDTISDESGIADAPIDGGVREAPVVLADLHPLELEGLAGGIGVAGLGKLHAVLRYKIERMKSIAKSTWQKPINQQISYLTVWVCGNVNIYSTHTCSNRRMCPRDNISCARRRSTVFSR